MLFRSESRLETATWTLARWLAPDTDLTPLKLPTGVKLATDASGLPVVLFPSAWTLKYFGETNPGVELFEIPEQPIAV